MINVTSNSGHVAYGTKEFICDTIDDIDLLPVDCTIGSTALVVATVQIFMLNGQREWVEIK